jgi:hypothetical protein
VIPSVVARQGEEWGRLLGAAHASRLALAALLRFSAVLPDAVLETARALERGSVECGEFRVGE